MTNLAGYQIQVADLLHDPNNNTWTLSQLAAYINEARRQLAMDTGCLRVLQSGYLTQGRESYAFGSVGGAAITNGGSGYVAPSSSFSGGGGTGVAATLSVTGGVVGAITFTNYGSGYTSAPSYSITDAHGVGCVLDIGVINVNTFAILGVNAIWNQTRYTLLVQAFSELSAWLRQQVSSAYQQKPIMWAPYGDNSIIIGPPPDQTYQIELDTTILPTDLSGSTADNIPVMGQDPIKYYAAYLAKFNGQQYGEGEMLLEMYRKRKEEVCASYFRRIPNIYQSDWNT